MLIISREAAVKVGKHAWNVYPLEAFGYLLGRTAEGQVLAALPCSKTRQWDVHDDRWNGIEEHFEQARIVASSFGLEVVGVYGTTQDHPEKYPIPRFVGPAMLVMLYRTFCCPSCSWFAFRHEGRLLERREDFTVCRGKRLDSAVSQRRILKAWREIYGQVDYSNQARLLMEETTHED